MQYRNNENKKSLLKDNTITSINNQLVYLRLEITITSSDMKANEHNSTDSVMLARNSRNDC